MLNFAKDAGLVDPSPYIDPWPNQLDAWERFAALVAAAEREACAKVCDERAEAWRAVTSDSQREAHAITDCGEIIRARSIQSPRVGD